jgi:phage shock protein A
MNLIDRFSLVMKTSISTLREKIEDPERMLHQLICDMEEDLATVRESVAAAVADGIQLSKQIEAARREIDLWLSRAQSAIQRGNESVAKDALDQKLRCEERAATLEAGHDTQRVQVEQLQAEYRELEDRIRQARHKRTLLVARLTRAESSERINKALNHAGSSSAFAEFSRLEERVDRAEALSEARDRLDGRDPEAEELAARFAADERRDRLQSELETLKQQLATQET